MEAKAKAKVENILHRIQSSLSLSSLTTPKSNLNGSGNREFAKQPSYFTHFAVRPQTEFPMDSSESEVRTTERRVSFSVLRWSLTLLFPVVSFVALSFLVGLVAVFLGSSSVASPISVPSQCKIVSTSESSLFSSVI